jgi:hypothetical protein
VIIFDLKCEPKGHVFEAWFASSSAFEEQRERGLVDCPLCGSDRVAKAPMAPAVGPRSNSRSDLASPTSPAQAKALLAAAAAVQKRLLEGSQGVGDRFAEEARAIHLGEAEARPIHGEATLEQAEGLIEEGVPIALLPFPVLPPGEEN